MPKIEMYTCQYCGKDTPASKWKDDKCPKCGKKYNPEMTQDSEE